MKQASLLLVLFALTFSNVASAQKELKVERTSFTLPVRNTLVYGEPLEKNNGILIKQHDAALKELASVTILTPELDGIKLLGASFNEFGADGVIHITIQNSLFGSDLLEVWLNQDLKELHRNFQNKEEAKKNAEITGIQTNMLPSRHNVLAALDPYNDLYTPDGQLYLYHDNSDFTGLGNVGKFMDKGAQTTLLRYVIKDKKASLAWQCKLEALQNVSSYQMLVSGNTVFLEIIHGITDIADAGQMNIVCIDYTTGAVIWNNKIEMTAGMRPSAPALSYHEKTGTLVFAGMESAPDDWKKMMKAGMPVCYIYTGSIDKTSEVKMTQTVIPQFESDSFPDNTKVNVTRPYWVPTMVVTRADGSHLASGIFGFTNTTGEESANSNYLTGTQWVGGSMFVTFGNGGASPKITCNYFENYCNFMRNDYGSFMRNISEISPCYWDETSDKMYMGLINSNEEAVGMTAQFTVGYYLLEIAGSKSTLSLITTTDSKLYQPFPVPYIIAVTSKDILYIPYDGKPVDKIVSESTKQ